MREEDTPDPGRIALFVRQARKSLNMTQKQFGEMFGCTKANVSHWELGKNSPASATLMMIRERSGVHFDIENDHNVSPGPRPQGPYPVLTSVQAGNWTEIGGQFSREDAQEWKMSTHDLGKRGFMLRVEGKSMENNGGPWSFREGMILHVNPDIEGLPGKFVVVRREESNEATFKRYVKMDGEHYLEAFNPDWPKDLKYLKLKPGDEICGVVVAASIETLP